MEESRAHQQTSLYPIHKKYNARMIPSGGWEMPVQYTGIIDEHLAVREKAGLFDVSHMGEIYIEGDRALEAVQHLTVNDASTLPVWAVQYSAMTNSEGGLVDDITVFRMAPDRYMFCVNASNAEKDLRWIEANARSFPGVKVIDRSRETALLALQGPRAEAVLGNLCYCDLEGLDHYRFTTTNLAGIETVVSRTGYTGEDGFELFIPAEFGPDLWEELMDVGEPEGLKPCGLGAQDTLRLEMGYALYGNDIDETTTPLEGRLGWITKLDSGDFIGRDVLLRQKEEGVSVRLAAFELVGRGVPRAGCKVFQGEEEVGTVTSGTMSPSLKKGIGLAYLPRDLAKTGSSLHIGIRDRLVEAVVVKLPFYKEGSVKKN